jgi:hypothetical protein
MYPKGSRKIKRSITENSPGPEVDLMGPCHVILEQLNVIENHSLSLADRVVINNPRICGYIA